MFVRVAALITGAGLLLGAAPYIVTPSANRVLVTPEVPAPGDELVIAKGNIFHRKPVGQEVQAVLGGDLKLTAAGESLELKAGTLLSPASEVMGSAAATLRGADVYCARLAPELGKNKKMGGGFGALLVGRAVPSNPRLCSVDGDRDGKVERAFLVETRLAEPHALYDITPIPLTITRDTPLPGESEIRLRFAGQVGLLSNLGFDLEVVESGNPLVFNNTRTVISASKLPSDVTIMGARFTVLSYDKDSKSARIRWLQGFTPGTYGVTAVRTTTYIPIYIPR